MMKVYKTFWPRMVFLSLMLLWVSLKSYAHEEPPKTNKEKKDRVSQEQKIKKSKIKKSVVMRLVYGKTPSKQKVFEHGYDVSGHLTYMDIYKNDSLLLKNTYTYSPSGDMITSSDFDRKGVLTESTFNTFDEYGSVISGYSKNKTDMLTGYFRIKHSMDKQMIEFVKYSAKDSIEYSMVYSYPNDFDKEDFAELTRYDRKGKPSTRITNKYNEKGELTEKTLFDANGKRLYSFVYVYDIKGLNTKTTKKLADGTIDIVDSYTYDLNGNCRGIKTFDKNNVLKMELIYQFEYYK
ncbi:MAG: hypothetical protein WCQ95_14515 [Bacteroidota bacterium]